MRKTRDPNSCPRCPRFPIGSSEDGSSWTGTIQYLLLFWLLGGFGRTASQAGGVDLWLILYTGQVDVLILISMPRVLDSDSMYYALNDYPPLVLFIDTAAHEADAEAEAAAACDGPERVTVKVWSRLVGARSLVRATCEPDDATRAGVNGQKVDPGNQRWVTGDGTARAESEEDRAGPCRVGWHVTTGRG